MAPDYYEDFTVGDTTASSIARTVSESEVYTQAGLEGNYSRIHTDAEYMADTEYGGRLVQNTLLLGIATGLSKTTEWDPATIAAYGRDDVRFLEPLFIGDTVRLESEVADKRERDADGGIVTFRRNLYNQDDDLVLTGEYLLFVERAP